jgi:sugar/nucleoside kinase (ribokinase family)
VPVPHLLVVGELNADIVVQLESAPRFGDYEHVVPRTEIVLGSSSAITACGTARLSVPTSLVSVVGSDLLGGFVLDELRSRQVDTTACRVDDTLPTGTSTILTLPDGDRSILTALGTIGRVRVSDIPPALLSDSAHVHVGSYFLQAGLRRDLPAFYGDCRRQGISTSLDPNYDPRGEWGEGLADLLPQVDVLFCNEREAAAISGRAGMAAACEWFAERLPDSAQVVVKLGARGARAAVCRRGRVAETYDAAPEGAGEPVVDTIGAGDSLAAGFLAARLRGLPVEDSLRVGVRNGTASTRAAGGTAGQLTWDQALLPPTRHEGPGSVGVSAPG